MKRIWSWTLIGLAAASTSAHAAGRVTAADLAQELEEGERITLIDARAEGDFQEGHLPGAIHVTLPAIARRELPPLGNVVVYGDGLGRVSGEEAMVLLDRKPGIEARVLTGGMAAWRSTGQATTHAAGLTVEHPPHITYQQLAAAQEEAVLVDLRVVKPVEDKPGVMRAASAPLTDLHQAFPQARIVNAQEPQAFGIASVDGSENEKPTPTSLGPIRGMKAENGIIVLIDNGDGRAEEMAQLIRASGNHRVVILAGGEEILRHQGRSGSGRTGSSVFRSKDDILDFGTGTEWPEEELPPVDNQKETR